MQAWLVNHVLVRHEEINQAICLVAYKQMTCSNLSRIQAQRASEYCTSLNCSGGRHLHEGVSFGNVAPKMTLRNEYYLSKTPGYP